jgi:hypothetical protein
LQGENGLPVRDYGIQRHWGLPLSNGARSTLSSDCQIALRFLRHTDTMPGDG